MVPCLLPYVPCLLSPVSCEVFMSVNGKLSEELDSVTIRFAGDSGDGMQLAGTQFTNASAIIGNDIATFPDFPAEIRARLGHSQASPASRCISPAPKSIHLAIASMHWSQ